MSDADNDREARLENARQQLETTLKSLKEHNENTNATMSNVEAALQGVKQFHESERRLDDLHKSLKHE